MIMTAGQIVSLVLGLVLGLPLIGLGLHMAVGDTRHTLWPRGLRWFPPAWDRLSDRTERLLWPDRDLFPSSRYTRYLEELDDSFKYSVKLYGTCPEWTGRDDLHGRWISYGRETDTCSCGYVRECALWCGDGHETGQCPDDHGRGMRWG
jgi:hypothetical protein